MLQNKIDTYTTNRLLIANSEIGMKKIKLLVCDVLLLKKFPKLPEFY